MGPGCHIIVAINYMKCHILGEDLGGQKYYSNIGVLPRAHHLQPQPMGGRGPRRGDVHEWKSGELCFCRLRQEHPREDESSEWERCPGFRGRSGADPHSHFFDMYVAGRSLGECDPGDIMLHAAELMGMSLRLRFNELTRLHTDHLGRSERFPKFSIDEPTMANLAQSSYDLMPRPTTLRLDPR